MVIPIVDFPALCHHFKQLLDFKQQEEFEGFQIKTPYGRLATRPGVVTRRKMMYFM